MPSNCVKKFRSKGICSIFKIHEIFDHELKEYLLQILGLGIFSNLD